MSPRQSPNTAGWFTGRTRLITAVSVVAVGLAGATAVSANIGILDSASDSPVGDAAVTGDLGTPATQVVDVFLPNTAASTTTAPPITSSTSSPASPTSAPVSPASAASSASPASGTVVQEFAVDVAGTVAVATTDAGLRLERVVPADGWNWTLSQRDPVALAVTFTNGARTFEFTAVRQADGTIAADVTEPIMTPAPVATAATAGASGSGDHDDDDEYDDDDHDDDHEDDDDDHEYEGGEDDD